MPNNSEKKLKLLDRLLAIGGAMAFLVLLARYSLPSLSVPQPILLAWAAVFPIGLFLEAFYRLIWVKNPWKYIAQHPLRFVILLMILLELSGVATWSQSHKGGSATFSLIVGELYVTIAMLAFIGSWIKGVLAANRWLANRSMPFLVLPTITFSLVIFNGVIILSLPGFHRHPLAELDVLFTVTSAVCVTGLSVIDLPTSFTPQGQVIMALLIQLGGLGTMTTLGMLALWHGGRLTLGERVMLKELVGGQQLRQTKQLLKTIAFVTIVVELLGTVALGFLWRNQMPHALLQGAFHAISAFCNAGFSLFQDSFISLRQDRLTLLVIMTLVVTGGLGFAVVADLYKSGVSRILPWLEFKPLRKATKVVLISTAGLILFGTLAFWLDGFHQHHPRTVFSALFQSITCRTAGFQIESQLHFGQFGFITALFLMAIGASPQSTGGGVRTTVFARLFYKIDPQDANQTFKRLIFFKPFRIAFFCMACYLGVAVAAAALLLAFEPLTWQSALYETFSGLGTVGLSRDVTPTLSSAGKMCIIVLMFSGRVLFPTMVIRLIRSRRPSPDQVEWV